MRLGTPRLLAHVFVNLFQILRHIAQVVIADNPLDVLEPADAVGNVGLDIHPIETAHDSLTQEHQTFFFAAGPTAAVLRTTHGSDKGAGPIGDKALEVRGFGQEVHAQLDHARPALGGFLKFDLHHLVPGAANHDTDVFAFERYHGIASP
jgi:hypothetical protein